MQQHHHQYQHQKQHWHFQYHQPSSSSNVGHSQQRVKVSAGCLWLVAAAVGVTSIGAQDPEYANKVFATEHDFAEVSQSLRDTTSQRSVSCLDICEPCYYSFMQTVAVSVG